VVSRGFAISLSVTSFNNNLKYFGSCFSKTTLLIGRQDIVVIKEIMLWAEPSGVPALVGAKDFSLFQNVQTSSGSHSASYCMGTGVLSGM
jgi:hypothetical protein